MGMWVFCGLFVGCVINIYDGRWAAEFVRFCGIRPHDAAWFLIYAAFMLPLPWFDYSKEDWEQTTARRAARWVGRF